MQSYRTLQLGKWRAFGSGSSTAFTLASAFGEADTGFALDATALLSTYQNAYGTNAEATTPGDAVGVALDQSQGEPTYGPELRGSVVTANLNGIAGTYNSSTGAASLTYNNSSSQGQLRLTGAANTYYRIEISGVATNRVGWRTTSGGTSATGYINAGASGVFWALTGAAGTIYLAGDNAGTTTFTLTSIKAVSGRNALQSNSGLRPLLGRAPVSVYTKVASYSQEIDNAAWTKAAATAPVTGFPTPYGDGQFARKLTDTATTAQHMVTIAATQSFVSGQTYGTFYDVCAAEHGYVQIAFNSTSHGATAWATYNLNAGTVGNTGAGAVSPQILALGNGWYRCVLFAVATATTTAQPPHLGFCGNANAATRLPSYLGAGAGAYVAGFTLFDGAVLRPYQRVSASTLDITEPAIAGVQTGATSYAFWRPDGVDDLWVMNLATAITSGTYVIAGRNGCYVDNVARLAGDTNLSSTSTATSATSIAGILKACGDLVGIFHVSRVLSAAEKNAVLKHYQSKGAGGELVEGAELLTNGTFDANVAGWATVNTATLTWDGAGKASLVNGAAQAAGMTQDAVTQAAGIYVARVTPSDFVTAATIKFSLHSGAANFNGDMLNTTTSAAYAAAVTAVDALSSFSVYLNSSTLAASAKIDNASLKQLVPQALVA
jgi:hypothetical protein